MYTPIIAFLVATVLMLTFPSAAFGQDDGVAVQTSVIVTQFDLAALQSGDLDAINALLDAGMTRADINRMVNEVLLTMPSHEELVAQSSATQAINEWYCSCAFEQRAWVVYTTGSGVHSISHRFVDGATEPVGGGACGSQLGCMFIASARRRGTWTAYFIVNSSSWAHLLWWWCSG